MCQQAIADLADKVYSQTLILKGEMEGNHEKVKIRQTLKPKETEALQKDEIIDVEKIINEQKELFAQARKKEEEAASPRGKKAAMSPNNTVEAMSPHQTKNASGFNFMNGTQKSQGKPPDQTMADGLAVLAKATAKTNAILAPSGQVSPSESPKQSPRRKTVTIEENPIDRANKQPTFLPSPKIEITINSNVREPRQVQKTQNTLESPTMPRPNQNQESQRELLSPTRKPEASAAQSKKPGRQMIGIPDSETLNNSPTNPTKKLMTSPRRPINPDDLNFEASFSRRADDSMRGLKSPMERFIESRIQATLGTLQDEDTPVRKAEVVPTVNMVKSKTPENQLRKQDSIKIDKQINPQEPNAKESSLSPVINAMPRQVNRYDVPVQTQPSKKQELIQKFAPKDDILPYWISKTNEVKVNQKPPLLSPSEGFNLAVKPQFGFGNEDALRGARAFLFPKETNPLASPPNVVRYERARNKDTTNFAASNNPNSNLTQEPSARFRETPAFVLPNPTAQAFMKSRSRAQAPNLSKLQTQLSTVLNKQSSPTTNNRGPEPFKPNQNEKNNIFPWEKLLGLGNPKL